MSILYWFRLHFTETELGKIIQRSQWKRASYVLATKIYWSTKSDERGLSRKHIIESVKAQVQRLQLPYVDIVIIYKADSMCPMEGKDGIFYLLFYFFFVLFSKGVRKLDFCISKMDQGLWRCHTCLFISFRIIWLSFFYLFQRWYGPWPTLFSRVGLCIGEHLDGHRMR